MVNVVTLIGLLNKHINPKIGLVYLEKSINLSSNLYHMFQVMFAMRPFNQGKMWA